MIKEEKIVEKVDIIKKHKYCDVCGIEIMDRLSCFVAKCEMCNKDLCDKCVGHEKETYGDYREVYCKECWSKGKKYRKKIKEHKKEISSLYDEWRKKCE